MRYPVGAVTRMRPRVGPDLNDDLAIEYEPGGFFRSPSSRKPNNHHVVISQPSTQQMLCGLSRKMMTSPHLSTAKLWSLGTSQTHLIRCRKPLVITDLLKPSIFRLGHSAK